MSSELKPVGDRRPFVLWVALAGLVMMGGLLFLCLAPLGCDSSLNTAYGQRGPIGGKSVNGTRVLGTMFESAGHSVSTWHLLSPRLREKADVIVWFPSDFSTPPSNVRHWLEDWLSEEEGRTLIYVGRDFDAAPVYWDKVLPGAPAGMKAEIKLERSNARSDFQIARGAGPKPADAGWFKVDAKPKPRRIRSLSGEAAWRRGVDPAKLEILLNSRLLPGDPEQDEVVLASGEDVLVTRRYVDDSQLIVIANGSFLLNVPLVNHEHRKLAGSLVREVREMRDDDCSVVFLESGGTPDISDKDPEFNLPTGLELFSTKPFDSILAHLAAIGLFLCFARLPIFGRPRRLETESTSDFGHHVAALGELLALADDRPYAQERLKQYHQAVRHEG